MLAEEGGDVVEDGGGSRDEVGELGDGGVRAASVPGGQLQVRHHRHIRLDITLALGTRYSPTCISSSLQSPFRFQLITSMKFPRLKVRLATFIDAPNKVLLDGTL